MAQASGFSLIELMVVLALVAILTGIGVLNHQALRPSLDLSAAVRHIVMDLRIARLHAVTQHRNRRIVFPESSSAYQSQRKDGTGYVDDGPATDLPAGIIISDCTASDNAITFRARGSAETFGTVTLRSPTGDARRIIVDIAGQVRVQ